VVAGLRISLRGIRFAVLLLLAGCGFHPMYAPAAGGGTGPAETGLAEITIGPLYERSGQVLRQALQERFERAGAGLPRRYDLTVAYAVSGEGLGIEEDSSITRLRLYSTASWTLAAQDPQHTTLASGTARTLDGFNVLDEQIFAADMETESVEARMAEAIADQITLQLAAWFNKHASK
jgi:LPS-assembly lipoprotein